MRNNPGVGIIGYSNGYFVRGASFTPVGDGILADKGLPINSFGNFYVHDLLSLLVAKSYLGMGIAAFAAVGNLGSHVSDI